MVRKGQMRSIEVIFAIILILIAYSQITKPLYRKESIQRPLGFRADRILEVLEGSDLLEKTIKNYDFRQLNFLISEISPLGLNHRLSVTYSLPLEINNTRNTSRIFLTRSIPEYVDPSSITVSSENYTMETCVTENWKAIPVTFWAHNTNAVDKKIKIPDIWLNVSYPKVGDSQRVVNLSSVTFYLREEEIKTNYTVLNESNGSYKINLNIKVPRLKNGSNDGILYYAYNSTLKNDELGSFEEEPSKFPEIPECPNLPFCYSTEASRKTSRYDVFFKAPVPNKTRKDFYLTYSYGTRNERGCNLSKAEFLNQSGIEVELPEEHLIKSTPLPFKKPRTTTYPSSIFLTFNNKKVEVNLEIWSQL